MKYSYNTGSVSGSGTVGGVVGDNSGTSAIVETSYNTGSVSGSSNVGGVVGDNSGTVTDNYYNTSVSDGGGAIGLGSGTYNNGIISSCFAITNSATAGVSNLGTFNTWDSTTGTFTSSATSAPWFEGSVVSGTGTMTAPMLVPDLPSATVTGNGTSVYNGANVTNGYITTYTMGGSAIPSGVTVTTSFGPNVNSYTVTPTISGTISSAPPTQTSVDFVSAVSGTWAITAAPLTVTGTTAAGRTYNGTDTVTLSGATLSGSLYGNNVTLSNDTTGTLSNSGNVGTDSVTTAMTLSGSGAGNFSLTQPIVSSVSITQAPLTVATSGSKIYDGNASLALTSSNTNFTGVYGQTATLNTSLSGTLNSANVGSSLGGSLTVTGSDLTGSSGFSASNYTLPTVFTGGTITQAPLTVTGTTAAGRTYNGTDTVTLSGATLSGSLYGNNVTLSNDTTGTLSNSGNVGTDSVTTAMTLSGSGAGNFSLTQPTVSSVSITAAPLTVTANSSSMTYGGTVPTLTGTVTGFVNGQTLSGDSGTAIWTTSATSSSNPGQYGITGNVTLGSPYSGDYTITQASGNTTALTITAATSTSGSSGSTGTGGSSSGAVTQGGITATNINPVLQTVDLFQKLPSLPEFSSPGNSPSNASSSPSSSGTATTLGESGSSSLTVIQPVGDDTSGDGILSVEELKNQ